MARVLAFPGTTQDELAQADATARRRALDPRASFAVEAPAGSGKTGLLVQRFLRLLLDEELEGPEEVLAITFTNKATAELLERVVEELRKGDEEPGAEAAAFARETRELARGVLARDRERGWRLLERTDRLNIRSIDSVCSAIANSVPVLSGAGGERTVLRDARPLYASAARRTLFELGGADRQLHQALRSVLLHRDGQFGDTERLVASMLAAREQWGELIPLDPAELTEERLDAEVRPRLEAALDAVVCEGLSRALRLMPGSALEELSSLAARWSGLPGHKGETSPLKFCESLSGTPTEKAESLEHWRLLIGLVLKADGEWRATAQAFQSRYLKFEVPAGGGAQLKQIVDMMESDQLREALCAVMTLPPARYPDEQWQVAKSLFHVLRHALVELKILFAERSECDFSELSLIAREALRAEPAIGDMALARGGRLRHLLVDEMQDTSAAQHDLLEQMTRTWDGHTQTMFIVGDPKQSIYLFRQARVERFLRILRDKSFGDLPVESLQLTLNFRSQAALVGKVNETFDRVFPSAGDEALTSPNASDVPFVASVPTRTASADGNLEWHAKVLDADEDGETADVEEHRRGEARAIAGILGSWREKPLPEGRVKPWRMAVLARNRSHLSEVAAELRRSGIPFRAVEVEGLAERQEVLDCLGLTRALLHPADRIAWLSVLHAPWCGLGLADLLTLTGEGKGADRRATVGELVAARRHLLSEHGQKLLDRAWKVLEISVARTGMDSVSSQVERTWLSLGGDMTLEADERINARRFFRLLREVEAMAPGRLDVATLKARLADLYAEPATPEPDGASVELMTIHRAKGLEWDVVCVPGLERQPQADRSELLNWVELDGSSAGSDAERASHVLLAPISGRGEPSSALNNWLRRVRSGRDHTERKRLFYVACTRAREELHLFAAVPRTKKGELSKPAPGSLLQACWPAAEAFFDGGAGAASETTPESVANQLRKSLALYDDETEGPALALAAGADGGGEDGGGEEAEDRFSGRRPPKIQRLPLGIDPRERFRGAANGESERTPVAPALPRPEGSFQARAFGNVVHRFLEYLTVRLQSAEAAAMLGEVPSWGPRCAASLRGEGLPPGLAAREAERVVEALTKTLSSATGRWILSPHAGAASESSLVGVGGMLRADRTFRAGAQEGSTGESHLWIVDFKTTEQGSRTDEEFAALELAKYRAQLERYAALHRTMLRAEMPIFLGLFYPLNGVLLKWESEPSFGL